MTEVGSVSVSINLALDNLRRDAAKAQADLEKAIEDISVQVNIDPENNIAEASAEIKGLKNTAKGDIPVGFTVDANGKLRDAQGKFVKFRDDAGEGVDIPVKFGAGSGADISELARTLNLSFKEAKQFATGLQLSADQANRAIATIKNLNGVNATTVEKFRVLHKELGITKEQYLELEQAIANTNKTLKGFDGIVQQAKGFADAVSASSQYTQALRDVSQILGQAGQQINQFTGQALNAANALDAAQGKVGTLSNDVDGLTGALSKLAGELNYQTNTTDLLNASYDVLSSGFSDTADVTEILRAATLGAQGGFTDVGTVTDALTTVMNAYGKSADEAAYLTDLLAQTQDKGKITIGQYAQGIGAVASTAALAGVSIEEISAAIATATAKGQTAEASISGVRQAIVSILKPTDEAQEFLEKFGIQNAAATLRAEGLVGVLTRLKEAGATTDDLAKIFSDVTGLATVATIAGQNLDDFKGNLDAMSDSAGKAAKSAGVVANTFDAQVARAFNLANESLAQLGKGVQSAALPLIDAIVFLLENFNKLPEPIKQAVGLLTALSGGALTAAAGLAAIAAVLPIIAAAAKVAVTNLRPIAPQLALAAAAGVSLALIAETFSEVTEASRATRQGISSVKDALAELEEAQTRNASSAGDIAKSLDESVKMNRQIIEENLSGLQKFFDLIRQSINQTIELLKTVSGINFFEDLTGIEIPTPKLSTAGEAAIAQQDAAFDDLASSADTVIAKFNEFKAEGFENQSDEEIEKLNSAIQGTIDALGASAPVTEQDIADKNNLLTVLSALQGELAGTAEATDVATTATEEQVEATSALDKALAALDTSYAGGKIDLAEQYAQGLIDQEQYQQESQALEQQYLNDRIALNQQKLEELRLAQSSATDPEAAKAAAEELLAVEKQIADDRLAVAEAAAEARVQAEEEAQAKILDALDQKSADAQTSGDVSVGGLDLTSQRLSEQQSLLSAQNDLLSAQFAIREQSLQSAIDEAEADENSVEAIRLKNQLEQERGAFIDEQFAIQRQQLELTQEQRAIDLERQKILSDLSIIEAEIAIEKARAEGASAAEIANLTRVLELRQKERDAVDSAISNQEKINTLEDQTLTANQELEHLKNEQASAREDENDALDEQKEKLEEIKALEDELRQIRADTQKAKNDAAVGAAEAEYDANPSKRNLDAVHDAREKALEDEFAARQAELDAESADRIAKAEEEATAAAEAYNTALGEFKTEEVAALEDGSISAEEQEKLDLLQQQNDEAREQVDAAQDQLDLEKQIADAKQTQLDTEKRAAQEAEKAKQKKETEDARAAGLLSGVQGGDVATLNSARNQLRAIQEQVSKFGVGRQLPELLKFAQNDSRFKGEAGQFNEILLAQLGPLGEAALNLKAIAKDDSFTANTLAQELGRAQATGNNAAFEALAQRVAELAAAASSPKTINITGATGESAQVLRELQRAESGARY